VTWLLGYLLAIVIDAVTQFQSRSAHKDPLHVTAHFLRPVSVGSVEIHVRRLRTGQWLTNLTAELVQGGKTRVTSHLIYGVIDPGNLPASESFTLHAPTPLARWTPFRMPPSRSMPYLWPDLVNFQHHMAIARDTSVAEHHENRSRTGHGPGGVEDGRWYELHAGEQVSPAFLPVVCDVFPGLFIGASHALTLSHNRFPTVTMSIEFKSPIPQGTRTIGVFGSGCFIGDPQGRHELYTEVWTAPAGITDKDVQLADEWRGGQRCLASAHQMALVIQTGASHQNAETGSGKPKL